MSTVSKQRKASGEFNAATKTEARKNKRPAPLSLRLNAAERAALEQAADGMSLSRYIKGRIFDAKGKPKPSARALPVRDHVALAQVLGMLGAMQVAGSFRDLAEAAKSGSLPVTPETEEELLNACAAVLAVKAEVMSALGYDDVEAP
ncbi:hypothetical protein [uncultured Roseobacter sp.]|uniref:hypothetical protein n=1 Tax=uncultured Roseobacter sp. TaxID=114847 RepID=UPI00263534BD|nr:hypothetical protein [uncultured Roseobacter sp.]